MLNLKHFQDKGEGFLDLLQYAVMVDDGIMMLKSGSFLSGWYYAGEDGDSLTPEDLEFISNRINQAFRNLGSGWVLHCDEIRLKSPLYPMNGSHFPDPVSEKIDLERHNHFTALGNQFETVQAFFLTYDPPSNAESKLYTFLIDDPHGKKTEGYLATQKLDYFKSTIEGVEQRLSIASFRLRRIGLTSFIDSDSTEYVYDNLLRYIRFCICGEDHPVLVARRSPEEQKSQLYINKPTYVENLLGGKDFITGFEPKIGEKYVKVVSIDGFPQESRPLILQVMNNHSFEYRWNSRFIFLDQQEGITELHGYRRKWNQKVKGIMDQVFKSANPVIDQDAQTMVGDVDSALQEANSGYVRYGYYTCVVVLMGEDLDTIDGNAKSIVKSIQATGFSCRLESANAVEAWLGTMPGHRVENVRRPLAHTLHLSHMMPTSTIWAGEEKCPSPKIPNAPPLMICETNGSTAFRLNLHHSDVGHTLILGPTGSGKSTLLALLAAQFQRYKGARVFAFDKGNSLLPLTYGVGGSHFEIAGKDSKLQFCPLANIDQKNEQMWAEEWIGSLLQFQGVDTTPENRNAIHAAMNLLKDSKKRTLTDFVATLQDKKMRDAIEHYTVSGSMGHLIDANNDTLSLSRFQTFEIEKLLGLGDKNALPVLTYLLHRIEESLDGVSPAILFIDECWILLKNPVVRDKIIEYLKVFRKANCAVVLATQSVNDFLKSDILDVVMESCPTKIFLPNPKATSDVSSELYRKLELNTTQIEIIKNAVAKQDYYVTSPAGNRLFQLAFGPYTGSWVAASGKEDILDLKNTMSQHSDNWRDVWTRKRGELWK